MRINRLLCGNGISGIGRKKIGSRRSFLLRPVIEALEPRLLLSSSSVNVLSYHDDSSDTGQNLSETVLTPSDVNSSDFAKLNTTTLDGNVYAEPLYVQNVNINLSASATNGSSSNDGVHSVIFAATQNDSLYAIDANTGTILWHDSFLNTTDPTNLTATTGVTAVPAADVVDTSDINPEIGIVATPTISLNSNDGGELYLNAKTKEVIGGNTYFVQRLWEIDITTGVATNHVVIGDTEFNSTNYSGYSGYEYVAGPVIAGTGNNGSGVPGDGWTANASGYDPEVANSGYTHPAQIAFNALLEMQRTAMTLVNGELYLGFGSHGDEGPYYGWIMGYNASTLQLNTVFNTAPTYEPFSVVSGDKSSFDAQGSIWMGGGPIVSDGTYLYVSVGNGAFNPNPANFSSLGGLPLDNDYGDAILKLAVDTTHTSQATQSANGWGLKVVDYFTPSNVFEMNKNDIDLGSSGIVLVDGGNELVAAGKEGRIYLINTQTGDMGEYNYNYISDGFETTNEDPRPFDRVLGEYPVDAVNNQTHRAYASGAYFDGNIYYATQSDTGMEFGLST
ncbi:MAG TPA: LEPR-XLL domain-containing protein, partial [Phycisphaerae bacterium]|nr:LEPR-XLL domain-containing protein [Phycisphaerae bacterium]